MKSEREDDEEKLFEIHVYVFFSGRKGKGGETTTIIPRTGILQRESNVSLILRKEREQKQEMILGKE